MNVATIETTEFLTCAEAGKQLKLSADTVRQYCHNKAKGKTPAFDGFQMKAGSEWFIHRKEVDRYEKERQGKGRPVNED